MEHNVILFWDELMYLIKNDLGIDEEGNLWFGPSGKNDSLLKVF
jgi:sugar lactone lactonase YvrE